MPTPADPPQQQVSKLNERRMDMLTSIVIGAGERIGVLVVPALPHSC
jgi:hypothetical protein